MRWFYGRSVSITLIPIGVRAKPPSFHAILAEEFCQELLAPIVVAYEDEKARVLRDL